MRLEAITQPIKAPSVEEHEHILNDKMAEIRLEYADRVFSKQIPLIEEKKDVPKDEKWIEFNDFGSFLLRYTPVLKELIIGYKRQKKAEGIEWKPEMYDSVRNQFRDKIVEFRETDHDHWIEKTMQLLAEERKKISSVAVDIKEAKEVKKAGIIDFDVDVDGEDLLEKLQTVIKRGDTCISIHLNEPIYKKTLQNSNADISLSRSLEDLAVQIVTKYPETRAIVAESWIVDTVIAKKIGLKIYAKEKYSTSLSFWGQFINSNGQIDDARVKSFLETGRAPYEIALGAMSVEDFLRKYLPENMKGKILLKEVKPGFEEKFEKENKIVINILSNLSEVSEQDIENQISQCEILSGFLKTEQGNGFLELIKKLKKDGVKVEDIKKNNLFRKYKEPFREYRRKLELVDREVII
ncbi:MAG: hypothetical protein WC847_03535 [Candidatus Paceibacterota bacterium]|jgi:hypothetical protein